MSVRIEVEGNSGQKFSSLDSIKGKVILNLKSATAINTIEVKLEGVSHAELVVPARSKYGPSHRRREREKTVKVEETHKFLYIRQTVFPPEDIRDFQDVKGSKKDGFTIPKGEYVYDFTIQFPANCHCTPSMSIFKNTGNVAPHTFGPLPPTAVDVGKKGSIKYFVKVTVNRSSFYKLNFRSFYPLSFIPPDPPEIEQSTGKEVFARREVREIADFSPAKRNGKGQGLLSMLVGGRGTERQSCGGSGLPVLLEVRLAYPPVIAPMRKLPLKMIVSVPDDGVHDNLVVRNISFTIVSLTTLVAEGQTETILGSLRIFDLEGLSLVLRKEDPRLNARPSPNVFQCLDYDIPNDLWQSAMLSENVIPPTFSVCNITRKYQLKIAVGISQLPSNGGALKNPVPTEITLDIGVLSGVKGLNNNGHIPYSIHGQSTGFVENGVSMSTPSGSGEDQQVDGSLPTYREALDDQVASSSSKPDTSSNGNNHTTNNRPPPPPPPMPRQDTSSTRFSDKPRSFAEDSQTRYPKVE